VGHTDAVEREHGPALNVNPKEFVQRYGSPKELLEIQEAFIEKYKESVNV
jgi:hypothetical protein